jgi:hypothetical protein
MMRSTSDSLYRTNHGIVETLKANHVAGQESIYTQARAARSGATPDGLSAKARANDFRSRGARRNPNVPSRPVTLAGSKGRTAWVVSEPTSPIPLGLSY